MAECVSTQEITLEKLAVPSEGTQPFISFCLTTRRRPDFLLKTLRSFQRQSFGNFEAIICDNDPPGSAKAVVESLKDARFHYHPNGEDLGMNASFNRSLGYARGRFVVMITDDDPIYAEMLEILHDLSVEHPGFGAYYGGCDVLQVDPELARFTLHRVGTNSTLAPLKLDTVRTYSAESYPHAFFGGELQMYTLWSTGMVRREIAQAVGGLPSYGSPLLGDFSYIARAGSRAGCVVVNRSLGCQTVHESNYGRKECGELKTAALGFTDLMRSEFQSRPDWPVLQPKIERFVGQWIVLHSLFLKQYFKRNHITDSDLKRVLRELFRIPYIRQFRHYFRLGGGFLLFQTLQYDLRNYMLGRMRGKKQT